MRKLLLLDVHSGKGKDHDCPDVQLIRNAIRGEGWGFHIATDEKATHTILEQFNIGVGLVHVNSDSHELIHDFMSKASHRDKPIEWLALVHREVEMSAAIRQLIVEFFYDYHTLPLDIDRLLSSIGHAYGMRELKKRCSESRHEQDGEHEMVGVSAAMRVVFRGIRKMANVDASVLILGESGTGKELAAKAIHERSSRATDPFIAVNCAALPASIIQSELFGCEQGAYTGAKKRRKGYIESAANGTLLLDEIGDLPPELQVNLLRFLQEGVIQRVGSSKEIRVDVRVIAATHVDLEAAVAEGRFRQDLYYRLSVLHLELPPLRERKEDIEVLAEFFFGKFYREKNTRVTGFSKHTLQFMNSYSWPGNVRELINRVRRAIVMCDKALIAPTDLGLDARPTLIKPLKTLQQMRDEVEQKALALALQHSGRNLSQAARCLDISRPALYRLMAKHGFSAQAGR